MTEIRYHRDGDEVTITMKGHAEFNPGNDVVCAGISTITYQMMNVLEELCRHGNVENFFSKIESGDVFIHFSTVNRKVWETVWMVLAIGYETIAESYPDNIRLVGVNVAKHCDK